MESEGRVSRDEFLRKLKEQWGLLWKERYDDRVKAEGVSVQDYPLLFMERGAVIFASRAAKTASFREIVDCWSEQGFAYSPEPSVGGWGKFIRTELRKVVHSRAQAFKDSERQQKSSKPQLKKGGKGWLHK